MTDLIAGRYRLKSRLGTGGMSTVHLAVDERLEREVAVKLLAEHLAHDEGFVARFRREALAAARLVHPNIVQVFDSGLDEETHRHYIVMEYVPGQSCAQILRERPRLPVAEVLEIVGQSCRGLDYAHRHGVVHRDVKPGNLLVAPDGQVKLADFGIAKATEQSSITQVGSVLGTAAYLAPEQARGEEATPASDLYALGVVTYQLLSGRLPYEAGSLTELALMQQREAPRPLDDVVPDVPAALADAVARALALDAASRYPDALTMEGALEAGARGIPPDTAETELVGFDDRAATRMLEPGTLAERPVQERPRPRMMPAPPPPAPLPARRERAPVPARRERSGPRAVVVILLLLVVAAAAAAIAVAIDNNTRNGPDLGTDVTQRDVPSSVDAMRQLIDDNTK